MLPLKSYIRSSLKERISNSNPEYFIYSHFPLLTSPQMHSSMLDADAAFKASFLSYVSSSILLSRIVNDNAENAMIGTTPETGGDGSSSRTPPKPLHDPHQARSEHMVACTRLLELARVSLLRASKELISCASSVTSYSGMPLVLSCVPTEALISGSYLDDTGDDDDFDSSDNENLNMLTGGKLFGSKLPPLLTTAQFSVSVSSASRAARINVAGVRKAVNNSRLLQAEAGIALDRFSEAVLALSEGKVVNRERPQSTPPGSSRTPKGLSIMEQDAENALRRPLYSAKKHGGGKNAHNTSASSPALRRGADAVGVISAARKSANAQRKSDRTGVEDAENMAKRQAGLKLYIEQRRAQRLAIQALGTDEDVQRAKESARLADTPSSSLPFTSEDERNVLSALATILAAKGEESVMTDDGSISSLNSSFSAALATLSASLTSSAALAAESAKSAFAVEKMSSPPGYRAAVAAAVNSTQSSSATGSMSSNKPIPGSKDAIRAAQIALKKTPHIRKSGVSELLSNVAGSFAKSVASATKDGMHVFNTPAMRRHTSAHRTVAMERKGIDTADSYIRKFKSHMAEEGIEKTDNEGPGDVLVGKKVLEIAIKRAATNEPPVKVTGNETIKDHKALIHHLHVRTWDDALDDGTVSMIMNAWAFDFFVSHNRHPTPEERAVKQDELQHEHAVKPQLEGDSSLAAKTLLRRSASVGYEILHPIVDDQIEIDHLAQEAHRTKTVDHNLLPPTSSSLSKGLKVWDEVMSSSSLSVADLSLVSPVHSSSQPRSTGFSARTPSSSSSSSAVPPPPPPSASRGLSLLNEAQLLSAQKAPVIDTVTGQPVIDTLALVPSSTKSKVVVPWVPPAPWNSGTVQEKEKLKAPSYQSKKKASTPAVNSQQNLSTSESQQESTNEPSSPQKHLNPRPTTGLVETTISATSHERVDVPVLKVNLASVAPSPVSSPTSEPPVTTHLPFGASHGHVHVAHTSEEAREERALTRKTSLHSFAAAGMSGAVIAGAIGVGSLTTFGGKSTNATLLVSPRRLILHKMKASAVHARANAAAATARMLSPSKLKSPRLKGMKSPAPTANKSGSNTDSIKASIIQAGSSGNKTTELIEPVATSLSTPSTALMALAAQSVENMMEAIE